MPDTPLLMAFDTSAAHCAAALLSGDTVLSEHFEQRERGQAETVFPILKRLLQDNGLAYTDLVALGVGTGPGNFTGLRIAVSAARGLSLGLGIPAIGISAFEVAAAMQSGLSRQILLPAPRGAAYAQAFTAGKPSGAPILEPHVDPARVTYIDWQAGGAVKLGRIAMTRLRLDQVIPRPAPLYVKPADAAPARDLPPSILP
ncbi:MAG: tRNA (adenosine(37)-N6)-threonylcarbamoyltransferase complex dimerization subunit type 1 TsaB [Pseudomonadota bacterium]